MDRWASHWHRSVLHLVLGCLLSDRYRRMVLSDRTVFDIGRSVLDITGVRLRRDRQTGTSHEHCDQYFIPSSRSLFILTHLLSTFLFHPPMIFYVWVRFEIQRLKGLRVRSGFYNSHRLNVNFCAHLLFSNQTREFGAGAKESTSRQKGNIRSKTLFVFRRM